jgi:hypothetical protein
MRLRPHRPRQCAELASELTCSRCGTASRVEVADGTRIVNRVAVVEWLLGEGEGEPQSQRLWNS